MDRGGDGERFQPARAALLAALALVGFACALMLFALLIRCATGPEVPLLTPTPTEGTSALWLGAYVVAGL
jgi:hypothetical protein